MGEMDIMTRMKEFYENRSRYKLTRKTYTIIRIDGKAFHTYTRGLERPFDQGLMNDMDATAQYLCKNIQGSKFAYVQSDEISILLTDFDDIKTDMWFDGNVQKIASVSASLATSEFNRLRLKRLIKERGTDASHIGISGIVINESVIDGLRQAQFDSRVFQIPHSVEIINYFIARQQDATRNSIQSTGQSYFPHKVLNGMKTNEVQEMLFTEKGINWNDYSPREKRGGFIVRLEDEDPNSIRKKWKTIDCPIFTANRDFLEQYIPGLVKDSIRSS